MNPRSTCDRVARSIGTENNRAREGESLQMREDKIGKYIEF